MFEPSLKDLLLQTWVEGARSRTITCCSRWSEQRRIMGSPFAGPYSFLHHPWARDIHDCHAQFTVSMKGAQTGVTETGINRAFYTLDQLKRDVLYVLPTSLNASDFSKARFSGALNLSPYLKNMFTDTNTVGLKSTGINSLYIRGSRGDSNLKSIPVSELILDEVDEMDQKAIYLALERLSGQVEKHVVAISTPTIPKYGIHKLYLSSTQEHFFFKCPHCGRMTELVWPDCIEIVGESIHDPRCKESFLKCKECKHQLEHATKPLWLADAQWVATAPNVDPAESRGFHVNQMYSSTVNPGELVIAYHRGLGDEAANKEFHNSKLGLPFIGTGAQVTDDMIDSALKSHTTNDPRPDVGSRRCITMGVDQGKWNYVSVVEWFVDQWSNDINVAARAKLLWFDKFLEDEWSILESLMREWQILACVIDADPQINEARRFARKFHGFVWLCRYRRGQTAKELAITEEDSGAPMLTCDRTNWLSATLGRFKTKPTRIELPRDLTLDYREHLKSLVRTYVKDETGNPVATFVETGPDHYAHSLNYAELGLPLAASITSGQDIKKFL